MQGKAAMSARGVGRATGAMIICCCGYVLLAHAGSFVLSL